MWLNFQTHCNIEMVRLATRINFKKTFMMNQSSTYKLLQVFYYLNMYITYMSKFLSFNIHVKRFFGQNVKI